MIKGIIKVTWVSFLAVFLLFDDFLLYNWGSSIFYIDYICQFQAIDPQIHKSANSTILGDYFSYVAINVVMICSNHLPYVAPNPHLGHFYSNCQVKVWRSSSNISWSFKIQYNAFMFYSCSPKKVNFPKMTLEASLMFCFMCLVLILCWKQQEDKSSPGIPSDISRFAGTKSSVCPQPLKYWQRGKQHNNKNNNIF